MNNRNARVDPARDPYEADRSYDPKPQRHHCPIDDGTKAETNGVWWSFRCNQEEDSWSQGSSEIRYGHCEYKGSFTDLGADTEAGSCREDCQWDSRRKGGSSTVRARVGRNARERRRVRAVSGAFLRLRKVVPQTVNSAAPPRRLSKLKTLKGAINYIKELQRLLEAVSYRPMCASLSDI